MKRDKIENKFRKELWEVEQPVPTMAWDNISSQIPNKENKKKIGLFYILGITTGIAASIILFFGIFNAPQNANTSNNELAKNTIGVQNKTNKKENSIHVKLDIAEEKNSKVSKVKSLSQSKELIENNSQKAPVELQKQELSILPEFNTNRTETKPNERKSNFNALNIISKKVLLSNQLNTVEPLYVQDITMDSSGIESVAQVNDGLLAGIFNKVSDIHIVGSRTNAKLYYFSDPTPQNLPITPAITANDYSSNEISETASRVTIGRLDYVYFLGTMLSFNKKSNIVTGVTLRKESVGLQRLKYGYNSQRLTQTYLGLSLNYARKLFQFKKASFFGEGGGNVDYGIRNKGNEINHTSSIRTESNFTAFKIGMQFGVQLGFKQLIEMNDSWNIYLAQKMSANNMLYKNNVLNVNAKHVIPLLQFGIAYKL